MRPEGAARGPHAYKCDNIMGAGVITNILLCQHRWVKLFSTTNLATA